MKNVTLQVINGTTNKNILLNVRIHIKFTLKRIFIKLTFKKSFPRLMIEHFYDKTS
jgi:hypothetical protein